MQFYSAYLDYFPATDIIEKKNVLKLGNISY